MVRHRKKVVTYFKIIERRYVKACNNRIIPTGMVLSKVNLKDNFLQISINLMIRIRQYIKNLVNKQNK